MKVKWDIFAKRRNLDLEYFIDNMKYDEYKRWCEYRSVIPVKKNEYFVSKPVVETVSHEAEPSVTPEQETPKFNMTKRALTKMKKQQLVDLVNEYSLHTNGSETKRQLVSLLLDMNT